MVDRCVHARYPGMEVVRYNRAGKWYLEPTDPSLHRQHVGVREAARQALWAEAHGGEWVANLPGGQTFDAHVRRHRSDAS